VLGTYVIVSFGEGAGIKGAQPIAGIIIALLAALSWAGYMITTKVLIGRKDRRTGITLSPEYVTLLTFVIAIIPTLIIVAMTSHISDLENAQIIGIGFVLYLGVLTSAVAFVMFNVGMKIIGVSSAAINQLLFPGIAVLISYLFLGEIVNLADLVGIGLIIIGIIVAQMISR